MIRSGWSKATFRATDVASPFPLTARGQDMGNKVGIDMGNSFHVIFRPFWGHVMEGPYAGGATSGVREVGFESPTKHLAVVSRVSNQPQERLQMEAALRAGGTARIVESAASSPPLAGANERGMAEASAAIAAQTLELGKSETARSTGPRIPRAKCSSGAHDGSMAPEDETQSARASAFSAWAASEPWRVDGGDSE